MFDDVIKALLGCAYDDLFDSAGHLATSRYHQFEGGFFPQGFHAAAHLGQQGSELGFQSLIGAG